MGTETTASGDFSVAMGRHASTQGMNGSLVFGDYSTLDVVNSPVSNSFTVRSQYVWFGIDSNPTYTWGRFIDTSTGAYLSSGGAWTNNSDAARKYLFADRDAEGVLRAVAALPIREWSYRNEDASIRHLGPLAQDFRAAFGLGNDDQHIATVDIDGVNMVAIQALEERTRTLQAETDALRDRMAQVETMLLTLLKARR